MTEVPVPCIEKPPAPFLFELRAFQDVKQSFSRNSFKENQEEEELSPDQVTFFMYLKHFLNI